MGLTISDNTLTQANLDEAKARIELACRLFDADKLGFHAAMRFAGLDRVHFENEIRARRIAIYRPTVEDLEDDLENLRRLGI
jgi:predicted HTH domain antitoxin